MGEIRNRKAEIVQCNRMNRRRNERNVGEGKGRSYREK